MSPDVQLDSTAGRRIRLSDHRGQVLVLFYEAKGHNQTNEGLKSECAKLVEQGALGGRFDVLGVADLKGLGFGPVKAVVKRAVTAVAKGYGVSIAMDFTGALQDRLGLEGGTSTVAVLDPSGELVFQRSGALDAHDIERFYTIVGGCLGRPDFALPTAA
ncbi:MAG: hypothetical protein RLO52_19705 [Sandaracinaceae bacterium]|nr:hypothetical protein [Myxococcales bacterium]